MDGEMRRFPAKYPSASVIHDCPNYKHADLERVYILLETWRHWWYVYYICWVSNAVFHHTWEPIVCYYSHESGIEPVYVGVLNNYPWFSFYNECINWLTFRYTSIGFIQRVLFGKVALVPPLVCFRFSVIERHLIRSVVEPSASDRYHDIETQMLL